MKPIWLFRWIGVFSFALLAQKSCGGETVQIGAIFSLKTVSGKTSQFALQAAVDDINSNPSILGGRKLSLRIYDANFSGFLSIMGALQFMEMDTVAIIGPQSSTMAHVLSHFGNRLQIPLLSFTALDAMLSPIQYPYFVQTAPNDFPQMKAIAEMVSYFGWTQVTAIFTDDDQSRNGITVLGDELILRRCKISFKAALPPDLRTNDILVRNLLNQAKMMESRVIVLHTTTVLGPSILKIAEELDMMVDGYVWISTCWLSTILDGQSKYHPERNSSIQGVITLRPHIPDSSRKRAFASRWSHMTNGSIGLTAYSFYAYDTVWMLAFALKSFWKGGYNISFSDDPGLASIGGKTLNMSALSRFDGGPMLLDYILKTNMTGLTGPVWYMDKDRHLYQPAFDILNVAENHVKRIGYWSNFSGLSIESPETLYRKPQNRSFASQQLSTVVWPGGTRTKPRGWVFPHNGRKLRIGVPFRVSFKGFVMLDNHNNSVDGYCVDVFLAAVKLLPYPVPFEFIYFGDRHQNPSYNELVNKITEDVFDAAIGDIAIVTNRTRIVDFTQPYAESGLVVVAPVKKSNSSFWTFLLPFTAPMWAATGSFFLIVGAVIWILEHRINEEFRGPPTKQFITIICFSFSTMFFAHKETTFSTLGRMVLVIWLFVVLIIQSSYTASLTSYLTVQQLSSRITGIDSLLTSNEKIGYQVGSFAQSYLNEELGVPKARLKALNSPEEYAEALTNGTVAAVVDEKPYVNLFLAKYCQFKIVGQEFTKGGWGFAFPRDSPIAVDMSTAILRLSEDGSLQNMTDKWLAKMNTNCKAQGSAEGSSDQLQFKNFIGLFSLCGFACFVALVIYFWKVTREYKRQLPELIGSNHSVHEDSSRLRRMKTFLTFVDQRKDDSVSSSTSGKQLKRKRVSIGSNEGGNGSPLRIEPRRNGSSKRAGYR